MQGFTLTSNGINFIKEYKTGLLSPCHLKQLTHHPGSLQQIHIHEASSYKINTLIFFTLTSPTYFCTSSEPMTLMKQASVRFATARAHRVFPVPGGPNSSTPFGGSIPRLTNRSGWRVTRKDIKNAECKRNGRFNFNTHVKKGGLDHFPELLDLLFTSTNITVGHIWLFLDLQKTVLLLI